MEDWVTELQRGQLDAAWDRFLDRYRRLIFAAIRRSVKDKWWAPRILGVVNTEFEEGRRLFQPL